MIGQISPLTYAAHQGSRLQRHKTGSDHAYADFAVVHLWHLFTRFGFGFQTLLALPALFLELEVRSRWRMTGAGQVRVVKSDPRRTPVIFYPRQIVPLD